MSKNEPEARHLQDLLSSSDLANVRLGLELAYNPALPLRDLSALVAIKLFSLKPELQDRAALLLQQRASADLRRFLAANWQSTDASGDPAHFYQKIRLLGQHPELDESALVTLAVQHRGVFPAGVAHQFPEAFYAYVSRQLGQRKELQLQGYAMPRLPESLGRFPQLEVLDLRYTGLSHLDPVLLQLRNLRSLDISGNKLQTLPDWLEDMPALSSISWEGNPISAFPAVLARLPQVHRLGLDMDFVRDLNGLEACRQVVDLHFNFTGNDRFPEQVVQMPWLEKLDLEGFSFTELPAAFAEMKHLEHLSLIGNPLKAFPQMVLNFPHLHFLRLGPVPLHDFPATPGRAEGLQWIALRGSGLEAWPEGWCNLPFLRGMTLRGCGVRRLPAAFGQLHSLRDLDLSENPLDGFPEAVCDLPAVETLNLARTGLEEVPEAIGRLQSLETLILRHNPLRALPRAIVELKGLQRLVLPNTQLSLAEIHRLKAALPHTDITLA